MGKTIDTKTLVHATMIADMSDPGDPEHLVSLALLDANVRLAALEAENQRLLSTFRHSHHRSDNGDSCAQCGLDLRHPIHNRILAGGDK